MRPPAAAALACLALRAAALGAQRQGPDPRVAAPAPGAPRAPRVADDTARAGAAVTAASLLALARAAPLAQGTALRGYDALSRERITASFALREGAPSVTVFRQETAARVRWARGAGLALDLLGRRRHAVGPGRQLRDVAGDDLAPVPYYPGRDALWVGGGRFVRPDVDTTGLVHTRWRRAPSGSTRTR
jgi:hypothetical protein